MDSIAFIH